MRRSRYERGCWGWTRMAMGSIPGVCWLMSIFGMGVDVRTFAHALVVASGQGDD